MERISVEEHRLGIACNSKGFNQDFDKLTFSVIIDHTKNSFLFIGFTYSEESECQGGFYKDQSSFMLSLVHGKFYNCAKSSPSVKKGFAGAKNGEKYTVILDIDQKTIEFKLNDLSFGEPKEIELEENDIKLLCPCMDISNRGDKISIVE